MNLNSVVIPTVIEEAIFIAYVKVSVPPHSLPQLRHQELCCWAYFLWQVDSGQISKDIDMELF